MSPLLERRPGRRLLPPPAPDPAWAWFLDIDGTLLEVAASPTLVIPDLGLHNRLSRLVARTGGAVALISGRTIADIDRLFGAPTLPVAGQHGLERRTATGEHVTQPPPHDLWERVRRQLQGVAERHPGLIMEDKGQSLALHYRQAPPLASFAHQLMHLLQRELGERYVTQRGKRVIELKPAGVDKGAAIRAFLDEPPFQGRLPIFLGDDVTDEYGFAVVNSLGGHSVKVGRGRTTARWRLGDVAAVQQWLDAALQDERGPR